MLQELKEPVLLYLSATSGIDLKIMLLQQTEQLPYTPSSVVAIFNNVLNSDATTKLFKIKGIYTQGKGNSYNGYYYGILKDEGSDAYITLIVPAILRASLTPQKTIV